MRTKLIANVIRSTLAIIPSNKYFHERELCGWMRFVQMLFEVVLPYYQGRTDQFSLHGSKSALLHAQSSTRKNNLQYVFGIITLLARSYGSNRKAQNSYVFGQLWDPMWGVRRPWLMPTSGRANFQGWNKLWSLSAVTSIWYQWCCPTSLECPAITLMCSIVSASAVERKFRICADKYTKCLPDGLCKFSEKRRTFTLQCIPEARWTDFFPCVTYRLYDTDFWAVGEVRWESGNHDGYVGSAGVKNRNMLFFLQRIAYISVPTETNVSQEHRSSLTKLRKQCSLLSCYGKVQLVSLVTQLSQDQTGSTFWCWKSRMEIHSRCHRFIFPLRYLFSHTVREQAYPFLEIGVPNSMSLT